MVVYGFGEISKIVISVAKITVRLSFNPSVSLFSKVVYDLFVISDDISKIFRGFYLGSAFLYVRVSFV